MLLLAGVSVFPQRGKNDWNAAGWSNPVNMLPCVSGYVRGVFCLGLYRFPSVSSQVDIFGEFRVEAYLIYAMLW